MSANSYVANWLIQGHRGTDIQPGEKVSMTDDEAAPLVSCGALSVVTGEDAAAKPEGRKATSKPKAKA